MDNDVLLRPSGEIDIDLATDKILENFIFGHAATRNLIATRDEPDWDAPIDLRVAVPHAVDLERLWSITGSAISPEVQASLGSQHPILLSHVVTPFSPDGRSQCNIWGLGYEVELSGGSVRTISVAPSDELYKLGSIDQDVGFDLSLNGGIRLEEPTANGTDESSWISIPNARINISNRQAFQFKIKFHVHLRKILGARVGTAGAKWHLYRQDETLACSHTLLQSLFVDPDTQHIDCTIKTWAKQAGWMGSGWGAKMWRYEDQLFSIGLVGLTSGQ